MTQIYLGLDMDTNTLIFFHKKPLSKTLEAGGP